MREKSKLRRTHMCVCVLFCPIRLKIETTSCLGGGFLCAVSPLSKNQEGVLINKSAIGATQSAFARQMYKRAIQKEKFLARNARTCEEFCQSHEGNGC